MEQPAQRTRKITPGKTILIKSDKKYESNDYTGIKTVTVSKTGAQFVLFDTVVLFEDYPEVVKSCRTTGCWANSD